MYKKQFATLLIIFLMPFYGQVVFSQSDMPSFEVLSPDERQSYQTGNTVEIQFKAHNFSPSNQQGITVRLAERNTWKRIRVGYITQPKDDGIYSFNWIIPDNFFERHDFNNDSHFKIILRANVDGKLVRKISTKSLLYIQKSAVDGVNSVIKTTATVTDEDEETELPEPEKIIPANAKFASRYTFNATLEPWVIRKLTVVNDTEDDGFEPDPNETANVIETVYLRYPNEAGQTVEKSVAFASYKTTFSGLDFYIPKHGSADVEIWIGLANTNQFSGETFRVGLQETGNTVSTFEAISQITSTTDNVMNFTLLASDVEEFVVRSGVPEFELTIPIENILMNGSLDAYKFDFFASSNVGLGRLVFNVSQTGLTQMDQVQIFRNGQLLDPGDQSTVRNVYLMWDAGATSCFAHTQQNGAGTGMDCNGGIAQSSKLIVTFIEEEHVPNIGVNSYTLRFNVMGVNDSDQFVVRLATGDDQSQLNIGGSIANTGKIYNNGLGNEIFSNSTDFVSEATTLTDRNMIWTDRSADLHKYTTFTPALSPTISGSSTADFTNGYLLKVYALEPVLWYK